MARLKVSNLLRPCSSVRYQSLCCSKHGLDAESEGEISAWSRATDMLGACLSVFRPTCVYTAFQASADLCIRSDVRVMVYLCFIDVRPTLDAGLPIKERYQPVPIAPNFYCRARDGRPTACTGQTLRPGFWRHLALNNRVEISRPSNRKLNLAVIAEIITADLRVFRSLNRRRVVQAYP